MPDGPNTTEALPSSQAMNHMIETIRAGQLDLKAGETPINVVRKLGSGGTKAVYDVSFDTDRFALGIPTGVDGENMLRDKWSRVLKEPENTKRVSALGLLTNTHCELMPISINGVPFQALRMARYEDMPFDVRDSRNRESSVFTSQTVQEGLLNAQTFRESIGGVVQDITTLLNNGVQIGKDSFNICNNNGRLRLYFNDLGSARFEEIPQEMLPDASKQYAMFAIGAIMNSLHEDEFNRQKSFFQGEDFNILKEGNLFDVVAQDVLQTVAKSKKE